MNDFHFQIEGTKAEEFYGEWNELDEEILQKDLYYNEKD